MQYELNLSRFVQYELDLTCALGHRAPHDATVNPFPAEPAVVEPTYANPAPASCRPG
ncbi:MAG: hypothetical protein OEQ29_13645 [Alphaproteobacteria bacterium]|nr:hypothetical protein [Alphaproteobacteria bacterium]